MFRRKRNIMGHSDSIDSVSSSQFSARTVDANTFKDYSHAQTANAFSLSCSIRTRNSTLRFIRINTIAGVVFSSDENSDAKIDSCSSGNSHMDDGGWMMECRYAGI